MSFTARQQQALTERLARAICWHNSTEFERDVATRLARKLVRDLDASGSDDRAVRRGLEVVTDKLEQAG